SLSLGPYTVPRLWVGLWQLSSPAWGTAPMSKIKAEMRAHLASGYTTFADHYGSAEIIFGQFRHTTTVPICADKWCIFRNPSTPMTLESTEEAVRERMRRTSISDGMDVLQIHWQDYSNPQLYLDVFHQLLELRRSKRLRIDVLGLVNFDTKRVVEICEAMGPGEVLTNQVQFSLVDVRPLYGMTDACQKHGVKLLTYGTFCGGFLADKWLGRQQPDPYRDQITPSQRKYLDVILNAWGGWDLFQELLTVLRTIADRHSTDDDHFSISNVATRWVLDQPAVGAVIVGARLGVTEHRADNARVFKLHLTTEDKQAISAILQRSHGHDLIRVMGDCGAEYR
ncbi:Aldo/keto reductase, partial [Clavulina sp. PMI_390]